MSAPAHVGDIVISAPGSFMLSGEHAVLRGHSALVAATEYRVAVHLRARSDDVVTISSNLGHCEMRLGKLVAERPFHFAVTAIMVASGTNLRVGFDLSIEADMPPDVGLGSSAAVSVAVYTAVRAYAYGSIPEKDVLWRTCRDAVRSVQGGRGSGADVAAAVYGGVLLYNQDQGVLESFDRNLPDLSLFYVGYKTPTADVIAVVEKRRLQSPSEFQKWDLQMEAATQSAAAALRDCNIHALGRALQNGQQVMHHYGVCDAPIDDLIAVLLEQDDILSAKISGSGLGDCVLALGKVEKTAKVPFLQIPVTIDGGGVRVE